MKPPLRYSPDIETIAPDEGETIDGLTATMREILDITAADYGHAVRSVHAKSHGILEGELAVLEGLPPELAQGIFADPARYRCIVRISTNPGDILPDSISVPRGLALKVIGVAGKRLPGSEDETTQDFVMLDAPAFATPDAKGFLQGLRLLAPTTDRAEWAKKAMSAVLRGAEAVVERVGLSSPTLKLFGGAANEHPLGETFYTATPFRFGDYVAKLSLAPADGAAAALAGTTVDIAGRPDAVREAVAAVAAAAPLAYELRVQLWRDATTMPIEDGSVVWDEADSPWLPVAILHFPPQDTWSADKRQRVDEGMRFSVWTGIEAHRPLGNINRARRGPYEVSSEFRARVNRCPIVEPT